MITGNGVLCRLNHNSRLGRAKYGLHVHPDPTRTFVARIIGDRANTKSPDLSSDLATSQMPEARGDESKPTGGIPSSAHADLRRPKILACHQSTHMVKSRIFAASLSTLVSFFRISCSGIRILVVGPDSTTERGSRI